MARTDGSITLAADVWASDPTSIKAEPSFPRNTGWPEIYQKDVNTEGGIPPAMSTFNQVLWNALALAFEVNQYGGGLPWDVTIPYKRGAVVLGVDFLRYVTKNADVPAGHAEPSINPTDWEIEGQANIDAALLAEFNKNYPVGAEWIARTTDVLVLPPRQGEGGITWAQETAGFALMSEDYANAGVHDVANRIDLGSTDGHAITEAETKSHVHLQNEIHGRNDKTWSTADTAGIIDQPPVDTPIYTDSYGGDQPHAHPTKFNTLNVVIWRRTA